MEKFYQCPECKHTNSSKVWDAYTKEVITGKEDGESNLMSCTSARDELREVDARFYCLMCDSEIEGHHLIGDGDTAL